METTYVIELIEQAFAGVRLGDAETIHQAKLVADKGMSTDFSKEEYQQARLLDPETDWRQVPDTTLDECESPHFLMGYEAWRFYLPAYMVRCITLLPDLNWDTGVKLQSVIFYLTYSRHPSSDAQVFTLGYFETLDEAQVQAVAAFLRYLQDTIVTSSIGKELALDAGQALESYWGLPPDARPTQRSAMLNLKGHGLLRAAIEYSVSYCQQGDIHATLKLMDDLQPALASEGAVMVAYKGVLERAKEAGLTEAVTAYARKLYAIDPSIEGIAEYLSIRK